MSARPVILVAEDDPVFRRMITYSIETAGYDCLTASNGLEAISILASDRVDLLITDHQMPLCSGVELIEHVRTRSRSMALPIILCTAKGYELDTEDLMKRYQLLAVMRKPFSPRQMLSILITELVSGGERAQFRADAARISAVPASDLASGVQSR